MHIPVLVEEVIKYLKPKAGGTYVDCTLGTGGHTEKIKVQSPKSKVISIDCDKEALEITKQHLAQFKNIIFIHDNFANLKKIIRQPVDGILFDLGLSSYQLDSAERGFSFRFEGPLDMRMDQSQKLTAAEIVNRWSEKELERIFREYGEERFAKRVARAICHKRYAKPIKTTFQLKEIVEEAIPTWRKRESVARIFQALRITVNQELENLKVGLKDSVSLLKKGGRIAVISYHSLEDRLVKQTFREYARLGILKRLTKKPVTPSEEEIIVNPRAKSAKLRAAERI